MLISELLIPFCLLSLVVANNPKITPRLQERLSKGEKVKVLVSFDGVGDNCRLGDPYFRSGAAAIREDRGKQLASLRGNLVSRMESSQAGIAQILSARSSGSRFTQFWLTNQMVVADADPTLINSIAEDSKVSRIEEEPIIKLFQDSTTSTPITGGPQPNLEQVKVPDAWKELENETGRGNGIVIGFIDGGARGTHETIKDKFLGEYGWYDPSGNLADPTDTGGHGTHVTALAVGGIGIGVAPDAKWIACRVCGGACTLEDVLKCGQFMTCPTLTNGTNHDCSKAPHIINNSWGSPTDGTVNFFDGVINCWHSAGIIPVFAMGNTGVEVPCGSIQYPASHPNVISVGNIGSKDAFSSTSSRGPNFDGSIKPDVVAPGEYVFSASAFADNQYINGFVGTSQSAPHVTGAIALLLGRNKDLTFEQIREKLRASADKIVVENAPACGNVTVGAFPNNVIGYGRLNVLELVKSASS